MKQVKCILSASLFIYTCMYTRIQVPFHKTVCYPSTSPLWSTLASQTPENFLSTSCQSCSYFSFFSVRILLPIDQCLHVQLGCACVVLSWLPAVDFIVVQLLLGYKAPLLFLKDIWSSFVMCLLGKPETSSSGTCQY